MHTDSRFPLAPALAALFLFTGCSSVVSGNYPGDAQFTIKGLISGPAPSPPLVAPSLGILWYNFAANGDLSAGEVLPITSTSFPAQFSFDLLALPPEPSVNVFRAADGTIEGEYAIGYILAFDDSNGDHTFAPNAGGDGIAAPDHLIGRVNDHVLVYVKTPPAVGSLGAAVFTDATQAAPGYHLTAGVCKPQGTRDQLTVVGADASVELQLGIDVPESHCINAF